MSESSPENQCPKCGAPLPGRTPEGLCPKCLFLQAAAPTEAGPSRERAAAPPIEAVAAAFPQLEIVEMIGQGGMGCVFKARQPQLNRFVALKILPEALACDAAFASRFTREAQALAALNHPNIVTIHDFGQANGLFHLLMEFVDGVNLRQALRGGRFTPEQALAVVPPICDALQYAHERGIVHRDIKPENLLLDKSGHVKIADFGIAKMVCGDGAETAGSDAAALQQSAAGTPQYMAPEQREQPQKADHRADIYSLGVVLYELLTGELPGEKLQPFSRKVQIDVRLDDIVLRALEREPERRYATAHEFKTSIQTVTPQGTATELSRPLGSASWASHLALGLLLVGTLGAPLLMAISSRHRLVLAFGALALFLALLSGLMSWRERLGKVVSITVLTIMFGAGITLAILTEAIPWLSEARRRTAMAEQKTARQQAEIAQTITEREGPRRNDAAATDSKSGSKRQRFEPREGMANQTSWSVHPKPSFLNQNGWAVMTRMAMGGVAKVQLPGEGMRRCNITLLKGDDDGITVRIDDLARNSTMTLSLRRDHPGEITLDGEGYSVSFPTAYVAPSSPDTSPFAHVIVTPVGEKSPAESKKAAFLPVHEFTLSVAPKQFASLEDRRIHTLAEAAQQSVSVSIDAAGQFVLEFHGIHSARLERDDGIRQWNTKPAAELMDDYRKGGFALTHFERFFNYPIQEKNLPMTFLLHGWGFLQVTGINHGENPGVTLRYKLVEVAGTGADPVAEANQAEP